MERDQRPKECPVCSGESDQERTLGDVHLYRCQQCDHCFTDPEQLAHIEEYSQTYYEEKHRNWFAHPNVRLFEMISRIVSARAPHGAMLDVGCGRGDLLRHVRRTNPVATLTGIDLSDAAPSPDFHFVRDDFQTWNTTERFDVVTTLAAIEHVEDVRTFVANLVERCKPGGTIVIMTLDDRSVLYSAARLAARVGYRRAVVQLYDRHHLNHFSAKSLRTLLQRSGLIVEQVKHHNAPMAAVDIGASGALTGAVLRAGVWGMFTLGIVTRRTYLQTVVARRPT